MSSSSSSLYSLASTVPLIKSPSIRLPPPISFPHDLHPLPPDITAYFVYPFSLESYVLSENSPNSKTISSLHSKHVEYLNFRKNEKERLRREEIKRLAPGWSGDGSDGILKPEIRGKRMQVDDQSNVDLDLLDNGSKEEGKEMVKEQRDVMEDLVDHLASLDSTSERISNGSNSFSLNQQSSHLPPPPSGSSINWQGST